MDVVDVRDEVRVGRGAGGGEGHEAVALEDGEEAELVAHGGGAGFVEAVEAGVAVAEDLVEAFRRVLDALLVALHEAGVEVGVLLGRGALARGAEPAGFEGGAAAEDEVERAAGRAHEVKLPLGEEVLERVFVVEGGGEGVEDVVGRHVAHLGEEAPLGDFERMAHFNLRPKPAVRHHAA